MKTRGRITPQDFENLRSKFLSILNEIINTFKRTSFIQLVSHEPEFVAETKKIKESLNSHFSKNKYVSFKRQIASKRYTLYHSKEYHSKNSASKESNDIIQQLDNKRKDYYLDLLRMIYGFWRKLAFLKEKDVALKLNAPFKDLQKLLYRALKSQPEAEWLQIVIPSNYIKDESFFTECNYQIVFAMERLESNLAYDSTEHFQFCKKWGDELNDLSLHGMENYSEWQNFVKEVLACNDFSEVIKEAIEFVSKLPVIDSETGRYDKQNKQFLPITYENLHKLFFDFYKLFFLNKKEYDSLLQTHNFDSEKVTLHIINHYYGEFLKVIDPVLESQFQVGDWLDKQKKQMRKAIDNTFFKDQDLVSHPKNQQPVSPTTAVKNPASAGQQPVSKNTVKKRVKKFQRSVSVNIKSFSNLSKLPRPISLNSQNVAANLKNATTVSIQRLSLQLQSAVTQTSIQKQSLLTRYKKLPRWKRAAIGATVALLFLALIATTGVIIFYSGGSAAAPLALAVSAIVKSVGAGATIGVTAGAAVFTVGTSAVVNASLKSSSSFPAPSNPPVAAEKNIKKNGSVIVINEKIKIGKEKKKKIEVSQVTTTVETRVKQWEKREEKAKQERTNNEKRKTLSLNRNQPIASIASQNRISINH